MEGRLEVLCNLVSRNLLPIEDAAAEIGLTPSDFEYAVHPRLFRIFLCLGLKYIEKQKSPIINTNICGRALNFRKDCTNQAAYSLKEMFFALKSIESYGSGIRRAKDALALNKSPELKFLPDNDYDDYTMAVIYINEEFAAMSREKMEKADKIG